MSGVQGGGGSHLYMHVPLPRVKNEEAECALPLHVLRTCECAATAHAGVHPYFERRISTRNNPTRLPSDAVDACRAASTYSLATY